MLIRPLRIIAALILMGTGLGLLGALFHTEGATHGRHAVARARRSTIQAVRQRRRAWAIRGMAKPQVPLRISHAPRKAERSSSRSCVSLFLPACRHALLTLEHPHASPVVERFVSCAWSD